jgi:hypothetical protein
MFQITDQCPDGKVEATTQILTSTRVKHLFTIPIVFWLLAKPHRSERPNEHTVGSVQGAVASLPANQMLENQKHHKIPQDSWSTN